MERSQKNDTERKQTTLLTPHLQTGTQTASPRLEKCFCMAPKQPTSPISDTRGVGDSSAASAQEDPIDRGGGRVCVCRLSVQQAPGTPTHTLEEFPCPVLSPVSDHPLEAYPAPPTPPTPQQPHPHQPSISSLCHQSPPSPLPHPSCGFDVQLPYKQGTPL